MDQEFAKKFLQISEELTDEVISKASNEELMAYLFLVEKMKIKLEEACNLEKGE